MPSEPTSPRHPPAAGRSVTRERRRRGFARRAAVPALAVGFLLFSLLAGVSRSGWTSASVGNSTDSALTGTLAFTHTYASTSCAAGPAVAATVSCAQSVLPTGPTVASPGASVTDTITNSGTLGPAKLAQTVAVPSCATVQLANSRTSGDPMLPRYATTFQASGPPAWGANTSAVALDGTRAFAADVSGGTGGGLLGSTFAIGVWFKVANGYTGGGGLLGLAASPTTGTSASGVPALWLDSQGRVRYAIPGTLGLSSGVSAGTYNDGNWHLAVLSVSTLLLSVPTLYVDNTSTSTLGITLLSFASGYWHLGWDDFTGVSNAPTSAFLNGSLAGAFVMASAVNGGTLFAQTSASAYASQLSGATHLWMLGDTGTTTYGGTQPVIGSTSPCSMVDLGLTVSGGPTISPVSLGAWVTHGSYAVTAPAANGGTQTATAQTYRDATYNSYVSGLYLYAPMRWAVATTPGGSSWLLTFNWDTAAGTVVA